MKCDELKSFIVRYNGEFIRAYKETEVDASIAELKQKLQDQCISCPVKMQEADVVAELKEKADKADKVIAELKEKHKTEV